MDIDHRPFPYYLTVSSHGITCPGCLYPLHTAQHARHVTRLHTCPFGSVEASLFTHFTLHSLHLVSILHLASCTYYFLFPKFHRCNLGIIILFLCSSTFPANYVFAGFDIMYLVFLSHTIFSFSIQYCVLRSGSVSDYWYWFWYFSLFHCICAIYRNRNKTRKTVLPVGMKYKSIKSGITSWLTTL